MPRSVSQRADKDTKYTGRWTSCKLLPYSLNGSEPSTIRSGQPTAHVHTCIQRTSGWYNSAQRLQSLLPTAPRGFIGSKERGRMPAKRSYFRKLLNGPGMVIAPFIYDCLQARLSQRQGFKAIHMIGFGTTAAHGFSDLGQFTMGRWSRTPGRLRDRWTSRSSATPTRAMRKRSTSPAPRANTRTEGRQSGQSRWRPRMALGRPKYLLDADSQTGLVQGPGVESAMLSDHRYG
jgi:hypothetical protein